MATYQELTELIKSVRTSTEATINGKQLKGAMLKSYLISKLSHPESVEIEPDKKESKPTKIKE